MTATKVTGRSPALPGRLARSLRGAGLSGAAVAGASAAGALVSLRAAYPRPPRAAPPEGWPSPGPVPQGRLAVAVVLGASGSVITDALGPYEAFARCPGFFVYTVSAGPAAMLSGGLAVVPDYSLGDVDTGTAPEPDVVVIPAVVSPAGSKERLLREWLARRAGRGAQLLGVCAGSRLLAAAGLLDGHRATSHWSRLNGLQRSRPQVDWVRGQRYVQDGKITTTAGVTSGVFGALRLVQQLAGTAEAQRVGRELAYPGWSLDGPTGIPAQRPPPRFQRLDAVLLEAMNSVADPAATVHQLAGERMPSSQAQRLSCSRRVARVRRALSVPGAPMMEIPSGQSWMVASGSVSCGMPPRPAMHSREISRERKATSMSSEGECRRGAGPGAVGRHSAVPGGTSSLSRWCTEERKARCCSA